MYGNGHCSTCDIEKECGYPYKPTDCCQQRKFISKEEAAVKYAHLFREREREKKNSMLRRFITVEDVCSLLNEFLKMDPVCATALISHKEACNEAVTKHPIIQVFQYENEPPKVGLMGLLNGMFGVRDDSRGAICYEIDSGTNKIISFKPTPE